MKSPVLLIGLILLCRYASGENIATLEPLGHEDDPTEATVAGEEVTLDPNVIRVNLLPMHRVKQNPISIGHILAEGRKVPFGANDVESVVDSNMPQPREEVVETYEDGQPLPPGQEEEEVVQEELGSLDRKHKQFRVKSANGSVRKVDISVPVIHRAAPEAPSSPNEQPAADPVVKKEVKPVVEAVPAPVGGAAKEPAKKGPDGISIALIVIGVVMMVIACVTCGVVYAMDKKKKQQQADAEAAVAPGPAVPVAVAAAPVEESASSGSTSAQP